MNKIAVYGTLRRGNGNHRLIEHCNMLSMEQIEGFHMYSLGGFPAVVPGKKDGFADTITVEVYEVDDDTLARVDRLEGYPGWYERSVVHTTHGDAYIYNFTEDMVRPSMVPITDGDWNQHKGAW